MTGITKWDRVSYEVWYVLQSVIERLQQSVATGITNCDNYYKVRQNNVVFCWKYLYIYQWVFLSMANFHVASCFTYLYALDFAWPFFTIYIS